MPAILKYLCLLLLYLLTACSAPVSVGKTAPEKIAPKLQKLLVETIADSYGDTPGLSLAVIAPQAAINWSGASGFADKAEKIELSTDQAFRIASLTKTYVAAAILRLAELDSLSLDESVFLYTSQEQNQILAADGYPLDSITIRHCLNHTSGLFDYAMGSRAYVEIASKNPSRRWTREEQLQFAVETGDPKGRPGEHYHYSDTGYILLGYIIEQKTNTDLANGLRQLLKFEEIGLKSTWLEGIEAAPGHIPSDYVRRYLSRQDFTDYDNSIDGWGGGGLYATTNDLATFLHALFNGQVFDRATTLDQMISATPLTSEASKEWRDYRDYRLGLEAVTIYGQPAYLHKGLWGTAFIHIPAWNATMAVNYTARYNDRLLKKVALLIKNNLPV